MIVNQETYLVFFSGHHSLHNGFEVVDGYDKATKYQQRYMDDGYATVNIRHAASLNE